MCTTKWFLVYSQRCAALTTVNFRAFSSLLKEIPYLLGSTIYTTCAPQPEATASVVAFVSIDLPILDSQFCCCSVTQSYPTLCNPMDCSMPGLSAPHYLLKFAQVHVHCIHPAISSLTPSFPSALNLSQHQGLFQWVSCSHQMTKILVSAYQSFQRIFRVDFP